LWFPHRARLLPVGCQQTRRVRPGMAVVVRGEVISWTRWSEHRRRNRRVGKQAVFAVIIRPLWISPTGWNISGDSLTPHLIINRCFPHGRHRRDAPAGPASTWCVHTVDRCGDKDSDDTEARDHQAPRSLSLPPHRGSAPGSLPGAPVRRDWVRRGSAGGR
jgi:hypothetical protein